MARTSKTVIGGGSGERSDRMMRAADDSGIANEQARLNSIRQQGIENAQQSVVAAGSSLSRAQDRNQQQGQFDRQMAQRESELDLEGAKAGFERSQGPGGDRAARLQAEMEQGAQQGGVGTLEPEAQQRLQSQMSKPLEDAGGKWVPTEERKQNAKRANFEADTDRIKAEAYADQIGMQAQRAAMKGEREQAAELAKTLAQPVNQSVEAFDRLLNAEMGKGVVKDSDWTDLIDAAGEGPDADPTLMADLQARKFSPRVQQFARAQISRESIKYIVRTGDTGNLKVDWTSPMMRQFTEQVQQMNLAAKSMGPAFAEFAGIRSIEDKMGFLNMQAAMAVYMGMGMAPSGGNPTGGMPPSTGGPQQQQPMPQGPGQNPHTMGASRGDGGQSVEAYRQQGRQAGAARRAGNPPPPIGFPDENIPRGGGYGPK